MSKTYLIQIVIQEGENTRDEWAPSTNTAGEIQFLMTPKELKDSIVRAEAFVKSGSALYEFIKQNKRKVLN